MVKNSKLFSWVSYFAMLVVGLQVAGYQYALVDISREYTLSNTGMGILAGAQFIPTIVAPLLFGGLVDKCDKRLITVLSVVAYIIGSLLIVFSSSMMMLVLGIVVLGSGGALAPTVITVMLAEQDPERSSFYASMVEVFYSLGTVLSPIVIAALMRGGMAWRGVYLIVGGCALVEVIALLFVQQNREHREAQKEKQAALQAAPKGSIKSVLNRYGIMLILFGAVYCSLESGFCNFVTPYFKLNLGYEAGASIALSGVGLSMALVRLFTGNIHKNKPQVVAVSCFAGIVFAVLMALFPHNFLSIVWSVLFGLAVAPAWPLMMSFAVDTFPNASGRMTTLIMMGNGVGGLLVNTVMGAISDWLDIPAVYIFIGLMSLIAGLIFTAIKRWKSAEQAQEEALKQEEYYGL